MHHIRQSSGIQLILDFGEIIIHQVIVILIIQFITRYCEGGDMLYGKMGAHAL